MIRRGALITALALASTVAAQKYQLPKMVSVKQGARASLTRDGAWFARPSKPLPNGSSLDPDHRSVTDIADDAGKRIGVRIILDDADLRVYVERDSLETVTIDNAELRPSATAPSDVGAALGRGIVIARATAQVGGTSRVELHWAWKDATIDLAGLVATARLGTEWEGEVVDGSKQQPPKPSLDVSLPPVFELLDAPNGKSFATRRGKQRAAATTLATNGAFALVRHDAGMNGLVITGWIASKQLAKYEPPKDREYGGLLGDTADPQLDLYDARDGAVIGKLWTPSSHHPAQRVGGWARYDLATPFGTASVWAQP